MIPKDKFDLWFSQIWNITGESTREHPAPYPLELADRLVRMFSFVGDVVLDPFCGSGTSMLAAMQSGRNSIGIEIDPEYCNMIEHRLDHDFLFKTSSFLRLNPAKKKINGELIDFYNKVEHDYSSLVA